MNTTSALNSMSPKELRWRVAADEPIHLLVHHPGYVAATIRNALRPPGQRWQAGARVSRSPADRE